MNPAVYDWAAKNGVSHQALHELKMIFGQQLSLSALFGSNEGKSEAFTTSKLRLAAGQAGIGLWRNNVGAMQDDTGRVVRFGLANESKAMNSVIKSGDLIGCKPVQITQTMVGQIIGQFYSREMKEVGWYFKGTEREIAQQRWIELITSLGGDAKFNSDGELT